MIRFFFVSTRRILPGESLDFLTICCFTNLDYDVVVPFFVLRIIFFGICLWKNDSYFGKRKDIFVFDVPN